jgi:hypothetical protein
VGKRMLNSTSHLKSEKEDWAAVQFSFLSKEGEGGLSDYLISFSSKRWEGGLGGYPNLLFV